MINLPIEDYSKISKRIIKLLEVYKKQKFLIYLLKLITFIINIAVCMCVCLRMKYKD